MTIISSESSHFVIARRTSKASATKQSISATCESLKNLGLYVNLQLDSLIRLYNIVRIYLLTTRGLDTSLHFVSLSMTRLGALIHFSNIDSFDFLKSRGLDCHESATQNLAMTIQRKITRHCEIFTRKSKQSTKLHTTHKGLQMIT